MTIIYDEEDTGTTIETMRQNPECYWGFEHEGWHDACIQKCVVRGQICAIILSITWELAAKICSDSLPTDYVNGDQFPLAKAHMEKLTKFSVYLLNKVLSDTAFSWEDIIVSFLAIC